MPGAVYNHNPAPGILSAGIYPRIIGAAATGISSLNCYNLLFANFRKQVNEFITLYYAASLPSLSKMLLSLANFSMRSKSSLSVKLFE